MDEFLSQLDPDPVIQFLRWFDEAKESKNPGPLQPEAFTLATSSKNGRPSARILLYKGMNSKGFLFFTNYESPKARNLIENPQAEMVFHWNEPHRQVRIFGRVEKLPKIESENYWKTRPRGSQLSAIVSEQSQPLVSRQAFELRWEEVEKKYLKKEIPLPEKWGGFCLLPEIFEFWEARESRAHDRVLYQKPKSNNWQRGCLYP